MEKRRKELRAGRKLDAAVALELRAAAIRIADETDESTKTVHERLYEEALMKNRRPAPPARRGAVWPRLRGVMHVDPDLPPGKKSS